MEPREFAGNLRDVAAWMPSDGRGQIQRAQLDKWISTAVGTTKRTRLSTTSLPSVGLSSAQANRILTQDRKCSVDFNPIEGVETLVPNTCPVAGFEVITIGRFCGDN